MFTQIKAYEYLKDGRSVDELVLSPLTEITYSVSYDNIS
jgi:hypothetical protein